MHTELDALRAAALSLALACAFRAREVAAGEPPVPASTAAKTPPAARAGPVAFDVRDFGAAGDGKADDTRAIQSAIDTAVTGPGATYRVHVPPGTYRITRPLHLESLTNSLHIQGAGDAALVKPAPTRLVWDGPRGGIMIDAWASFGLHLEDLKLDGADRAGILIRVNSRHGTPSDDWFVERVTLARAGTGIECGALAENCAADMTFLDLVMSRLEVGFHARAHQAVNYAFVRPVLDNVDTGLWFEKGGSVTCNLLAGSFVGTAVRIDAGDVNTGNYCFNGVKIECYRWKGRRTVLLNARGYSTVVKIVSLNSGTIDIDENGKEPYTPLFVLGPSASVSVDSSLVWGRKIADLTGSPDGPPTWLQFENCTMGWSEPRNAGITRDANSGFELRNCREVRGMIPHTRAEPERISVEIPCGLRGIAESGTRVALTWTDVSNEKGYRVERAAGAEGGWSEVGRTAADVTRFVDEGLAPGATYRYRVSGFLGRNVSWPSGVVEIATSSR